MMLFRFVHICCAAVIRFISLSFSRCVCVCVVAVCCGWEKGSSRATTEMLFYVILACRHRVFLIIYHISCISKDQLSFFFRKRARTPLEIAEMHEHVCVCVCVCFMCVYARATCAHNDLVDANTMNVVDDDNDY